MKDVIRVFIGHDSHAQTHTRVCEESILANTYSPVLVERLDLMMLRRASLYRRSAFMNQDEVMIDTVDERPFSTEFAFSRFLVPILCQWRGWALFCDSDFMFKADIAQLWALRDPQYAVMVAQQHYRSKSSTKKLRQPQNNYHRKNWSSLMLWNCGHPENARLTSYMVNTYTGSWLHQFAWLSDSSIGDIPHQWNWIEGTTDGDPKAVHFTMGTPDLPGHDRARYAAEWLEYAAEE